MSGPGLPSWWSGARDCGYGLYQNRNQRTEAQRLEGVLKERGQVLDGLIRHQQELQETIETGHELEHSFHVSMKHRGSGRRTQRDGAEVVAMEAEVQRLRRERAALCVRRRGLTQELQNYGPAKEFMDRICKLHEFKDTDAVADHMDSVHHVREELVQKEELMLEQVDVQRNALVSLRGRHDLLKLQNNNQLSTLQSELEKTRSHTQAWEKEWNHIQETAAKKVLMLGRIKMATLNLFEMTGATVGEEGVDMNDTETQLEHTRVFLEIHHQIVQQANTH